MGGRRASGLPEQLYLGLGESCRATKLLLRPFSRVLAVLLHVLAVVGLHHMSQMSRLLQAWHAVRSPFPHVILILATLRTNNL